MTISFARSVSSVDEDEDEDGDGEDDGEERGGRPDLLSSPDVLTWRKTLRGSVRVSGRALLSAVASLVDEMVWTAYKFGIAALTREISQNQVPGQVRLVDEWRRVGGKR